MPPALDEEQDTNHIMPPPIIDTDSDGSDPEEVVTSEELLTATEEEKPSSNNINGVLVETVSNGNQAPVHIEEEKEEIEVNEVSIPPPTVDDIVAHGENASTSAMRSTTSNPDLQIDSTATGLASTAVPTLPVPTSEVQLPRGTAIRENDTTHDVESTQSAPAPTDEGSHQRNITEKNVTDDGQPQNQNIEVEQPQTPEKVTDVKVVCHPSKHTRDDSFSTLQPEPNNHQTPGMPPNARPPRVDEDEDPEEFYPPPSLRILEKEMSNAGSVAEIPDNVETSSTRNTSPLEETESVLRIPHVRSAVEAPASPYQSVALPEDSQDAGSIVVAPPGTIVFQHPSGEHAFLPPVHPQHGHYGYPIQMQGIPHAMMQPMSQMMAPVPVPVAAAAGGGRRKITLRLEEDAKDASRKSFFFRRRSRSNFDSLQSIEEHGIDRGNVTVSWFDGTSSVELQEHVRKSVVRKMQLPTSTQLVDLRILDQSVEPPEEIVLSPFIPDGSSFLLRFSTQAVESRDYISSINERRAAFESSAPQTPSAAPTSPYPSSADLARLNAQLLRGKLNALKPPLAPGERRKSALRSKSALAAEERGNESDYEMDNNEVQLKKLDEVETASRSSDCHDDDIMGYNPEDQVDVRLRQIADLLIEDRKSRRPNRARKEKRQVIFVIANYFVLFLSFIAISAELSARAPKWLGWIESQLQSVQKCSTDQDALFECVSEGDFAGLVASFILFLSRSAATKRFFLFGFETPKKLWTVVYESLVTAVCWGLSYIVIRRGMNPDTRVGFVRKYWKDAVYGSLAGFNAAFMKHILKNLIPQDALEDAFQERQLKILSWLPSFQ